MPRSSSSKCEEMGHGKDDQQRAHLHESARYRNSFRGMMAVPRSSDPVERDLRRDFELHCVEGTSFSHKPSTPRYTIVTPRDAPEEIGAQRGIVHGMETLWLDDDEYTHENEFTTRQDSSISNVIGFGMSTAKALGLASTRGGLGLSNHTAAAEPLQNSYHGQGSALLGTQQKSQVVAEFQIITIRDNEGSRQDKGRSARDKPECHMYTHRRETTAVNIPTFVTERPPCPDKDAYAGNIPSRSLQGTASQINYCGIGSWTIPAFLITHNCESILSNEIVHPDIVSFQKDAVQQITTHGKGEFTHCAGNTGSRPPNACGQPNQSTQKLTMIGRATPTHPKGKKRQLSNDGDEEDEDEGELEREVHVTPKNNYKLACPFFKRYPQHFRVQQGYKFRTCATTSFRDIPRLKEHLYRKHQQQIVSSRCQNPFNDTASLDLHRIEAERCPIRSSEIVMFITPDQVEHLKIRTPVPNHFEKWREIYSFIFPGIIVPSPTHEVPPDADPPSQREDTSFISMLSSQMPALLHPKVDERLRELGLDDMWARILTENILPIVEHCQIKLWREYKAQQQKSPFEQYSGLGEGIDEAVTAHLDPVETPGGNPGLVSDIDTPLGISFSETTSGTTNTNHIQIPETPSTAKSALFLTPMIYRPESSRSDSGYGTLTPCGKTSCDGSSCGACMGLMASPTFHKSQLQGQMIPSSFTIDEVMEFGDAGGSSMAIGSPHQWIRSKASEEIQSQENEDDDSSSYYTYQG